MNPAVRTAALLALLLPLAACTYSSSRAVYLDTRVNTPLDVPPEMVKPRGDGALALPERARVSVREQEAAREALAGNVRVVRDGAMRWLEVQLPPDQLWSRMLRFWEEQGFEVELRQPDIGIMETDWRENRAGLPRGLLGRLYTADIRDKYRVRVEAGRESGTSEVYIAHRGLREEAFEGVGTQVTTVWQWRPSDPELEVEMLMRLMRFLGLPEDSVAEFGERRAAAARTEDGALRVDAALPVAWRRVGLALDRLGAEFERRDAAAGVYEVRVHPAQSGRYREQDPARAARYAVELREEGGATRVQLRALDGQDARRLADALAERLV